MTPANINIEETAIGVQYAISCTERLIKPQRHVYRGTVVIILKRGLGHES